MKMPTRWPIAATLLAAAALAAPAAEAQTCNGFSSFATSPTRADGTLNFGDNVTQVLGGVNFGRAQGGFAGVNAGFTTIDGADGTGINLGANAGLQIPLGTTSGGSGTGFRPQFCPVAELALQFGPNGDDVDVSSQTLLLGGRIGGDIAMTPTARLLPFAGLDLALGRVSVSVGDESDSDTDTFGRLSLGAGILLNQRYTIRPAVYVPLGLEGADASFGITLGVAFGRR